MGTYTVRTLQAAPRALRGFAPGVEKATQIITAPQYKRAACAVYSMLNEPSKGTTFRCFSITVWSAVQVPYPTLLGGRYCRTAPSGSPGALTDRSTVDFLPGGFLHLEAILPIWGSIGLSCLVNSSFPVTIFVTGRCPGGDPLLSVISHKPLLGAIETALYINVPRAYGYIGISRMTIHIGFGRTFPQPYTNPHRTSP